MKNIRDILRLYFIMGSQNCTTNPRVVLEAALQGGITCFQYREKGQGSLQGEDKVNLGHDLRQLCQRYGVPFIVNDDLELAKTLDADGVHVGQDDTPIQEVIDDFQGKIIGLSTTSVQEALQAPFDQIDYIGVGPIYQTSTKNDAKTPIGLDGLTRIREHLPSVPIVAIGGITEENTRDIIRAGADGISLISTITTSSNPKQSTQNLFNHLS